MFDRVSIITPTLNSARFIEENLVSVRDQTYQDIEHIVIDGGSTDGTVDILKKYQGEYDLKWISEPDSGQSGAFNKGVKLSTGQWFLFVNSDDYLLSSDSIGKMILLINNEPGYFIYMCCTTCINEFGDIIYEELKQPFKYKIYTHDILMNKYAEVVHQGTFYHKKVFETVGLYDVNYRYHMDYEFHLRASKIFDIYTTMEFRVCAQRVHSQMVTKKRTPKRFIEIYKARRKNGGSIWNQKTVYVLKGLINYYIYEPNLYLILRKVPFARKIYKFMNLDNNDFNKIAT